MIALIQRATQKHYKWLFSILLVVIVIAFVFTIGETPAGFGSDRPQQQKPFYQYNLNNPRVTNSLLQEFELANILHSNFYPSEEQAQLAFYQRLTLTHMANKLGLANPGQAEIDAYVRALPRFQNEEGEYDAAKFAQFVQPFNTENSPVNQTHLTKLLQREVRLQTVREALAGPGFVFPTEISKELASVGTQWNALHITLPVTALPRKDAVLTTAQLAEFYKQNEAAFRVPAQVDVKLVRADIEAFESTQAAMQFLSDTFALKLYEDEIKQDSEAYTALVKELQSAGKIKVDDIPPYSRADVAQLITQQLPDFPQSALTAAFDLNAQRYFTDAMPLPSGGAVVVILEAQLPEHLPALEGNNPAVQAAYLRERHWIRFANNAETWQGELKTALAEKDNGKKSSYSIQLSSATLPATAKRLDAFTLPEAPESLAPSLLRALLKMNTGEITPMLLAGEQGEWLHVSGKTVPEIDTASAAFEDATQQGTNYTRALGLNATTVELIRRALASEATTETAQ